MSELPQSLSPPIRCVIYTRKSSEEGLEQNFNSLDAQREAGEAYIKSQRHEGWVLTDTEYDDGGFSGGNMNRPALVRLLEDIKSGLIDIIVVYKVDRLSRSLADFSKMVELFDQYGASFVSITQQFNTSTSMGRLTLNVLLSFAQFEREVTGERIRDKFAASKKKGLWMGGPVPLGYDAKDRALVVNETEAKTVNHIYQRYLVLGSVKLLKQELDREGFVNKRRKGGSTGRPFSRGGLYTILKSPLYIGKIQHKDKLYSGVHKDIVDKSVWGQTQEILSKNRHHQYLRTSAKEPSLLAGLLFDDSGNPLSPTHTRKKSRRYRYYVNQAVVQFKQVSPDALIRVPAQTIETLVEQKLIQLLRNPGRLFELLQLLSLSATAHQNLIQQASILAKTWGSKSIHQRIELLSSLMDKIKLSRTELIMHLSPVGLTRVLLNRGLKLDSDSKITGKSFQVCVPVSLKRCGVETKLIVEQKDAYHYQKPHADSLRAIQQALQKALLWNNALLSGVAQSKTQLAEHSGVSTRYITQLIKLAYLSPDIIQRIFSGDIPHDLTLGKLKRQIPLSWDKQEVLFS